MENWVDGAELTRELEGDGVGARFPYNVKWAQVLFRKFLGWPPSSKELHLDISLVADFQLGSLCPMLICILLIPLLSLCNVLLQLRLDAFQVCHEHLHFSQQCIGLWVRCELRVIPFVHKEWGHSHHHIHGIVVGKFSHWEYCCPVILLV